MKVLFTSPFLMYPAAGGPYLRSENSVKALAAVSELHVISRIAPFAMGGHSAVEFYKKWSKVFLFAPTVANLSSNRYIRFIQRHLRRFLSNDAKFIVRYAKKHDIQIIWFGFGNVSFPLMKQISELEPSLRLICDTDSVWSRFIFRELPFVDNDKEQKRIISETQLKEAEEKAWVNLCNVTTAVSEVDAKYYRFLTKEQSKVALFSNVLDLDNYANKMPAPAHLKSPAIYLAGSFGKESSAMNRAAVWLLNGILPLVKKRIPNVHCYILGSYSDVAFRHVKDPAVTILGKVDTVLPYLKHMTVALTPLQFESGTRFKILEAAACKVPMVSTTLGAEGLPVVHDEHILIADTTEDFAEAIIRIILNDDLAERLANNSYELVKQYFGLDRLTQEARDILAKVS